MECWRIVSSFPCVTNNHLCFQRSDRMCPKHVKFLRQEIEEEPSWIWNNFFWFLKMFNWKEWTGPSQCPLFCKKVILIFIYHISMFLDTWLRIIIGKRLGQTYSSEPLKYWPTSPEEICYGSLSVRNTKKTCSSINNRSIVLRSNKDWRQFKQWNVQCHFQSICSDICKYFHNSQCQSQPLRENIGPTNTFDWSKEVL